jgi:integrase/recombinase XerD
MRGDLRVVQGGAAAVPLAAADPERFQAECAAAYAASWVARGFSQVTVDSATSRLERVLATFGKPAWEVTREDVDRVVGSWAAAGIAASTRRTYVQAFKGFHEFLTARKAGEIEAAFGVRLESPLDEFNAARHVANDSAPATAPPSPERLAEFFEFLRGRVATARKFGSAGRDYALYRTLYHAGLRAEEAASLELGDLHFGRGPFGKIHVRFGKGAKTSGPRPRWVPMLDGLDLILRWFTDDVRTRFPDSPDHCSATRAAAGCTGARSATGCVTCSTWRPARPPAGSPRTHFATRAPPTTMRGAWTWWPSSRCSGTGRSAPRCGTSRPRPRSSRTPTGARYRVPWPSSRRTAMDVKWRLRMAAAQREVWTGAQLRRLLAERAGLQISSASVSALLTKAPAQVKLSTLAALCTALECGPGDLIEVDTTPVTPAATPARQPRQEPRAARGRSMPPV